MEKEERKEVYGKHCLNINNNWCEIDGLFNC